MMTKFIAALSIIGIFFFFTPIPFAHAAAVTKNHSAQLGGTLKGGAAGTSATWSHTGTGDNYLLVGLSLRGTPSSVSCTAMGAAMGTALGSLTGNTLFENYVFGLSSSTLGVGNIVCSWTGSSNAAAISDSFSGVVSVGTVQTNSTSGAHTVAITATITANDLLWQAASSDNTWNTWGTISPTATTTTSHCCSVNFNSNGENAGTVSGSGSVTNTIYSGDGDLSPAGIGVPLIGAVVQPYPIFTTAFWWW